MGLLTTIPDFELSNPLYAGAGVSFFTVDPTTFAIQTTLAALYNDPLGQVPAANPQVLDSTGKFAQAVYCSVPVIATVSGINAPSSSTGVIFPRDTIPDDLQVFTGVGGVSPAQGITILVIDKAVGAATTVTLPPNPSQGQMITVKDGKGDAAVNAITITAPATGISAGATIDGAASAIINNGYDFLTIAWNGVQYNVVGR